MCIYDVVVLILFILWILQYATQNSRPYFILGVCILLFIMLFRSPEFGADVPYFYDVYLGVGEDTPEPGFMLWCKILRLLPSSAFIFTFMTYLFIMTPVIKGINKYSNDKIASLIGLMVITGMWTVHFITMRQAMAQAIMLCGILAYFNKVKHWKLILIICFSIVPFFHTSTIISIPILYFIFHNKFEKRYYLVALAISFVFSGVATYFLADIFNSITSTISILNRMNGNIENEDFFFEGFGLIQAAPTTILSFWILHCAKGQSLNIFQKSFVTGSILFNLLGQMWLTNRLVCIFWVLGLWGAFPSTKKMPLVIGVYAILAWRLYSYYQDNMYFLPYQFVFE